MTPLPGQSYAIEPDIVAAIAYCRIGRHRPVDDASFGKAKALGLLAQDPCWRATARGEGILVAAGLLKGEPAPEQITLAIRWAVCERYPRPQTVRVWTEWAWEHVEQQEVEDADTEFCGYDDQVHGWRFFTTFEQLDAPEVREEATL